MKYWDIWNSKNLEIFWYLKYLKFWNILIFEILFLTSVTDRPMDGWTDGPTKRSTRIKRAPLLKIKYWCIKEIHSYFFSQSLKNFLFPISCLLWSCKLKFVRFFSKLNTFKICRKNLIVICYKQKEINTNVLPNGLLVKKEGGQQRWKSWGKEVVEPTEGGLGGPRVSSQA